MFSGKRRIPMSKPRVINANSPPIADRSQVIAPVIPGSVSMAELESLLRVAQANARPQFGTHGDELGPGDVQYLRGNATPQSSSSMSDNLQEIHQQMTDPAELLQHAE